MYKVKDLISANDIQNRIFYLNDTHVMIDRDLAELYQVETKVLNQSVKRNIERFPDNFRFQLSTVQKNELVTNCDRFKNLKHSSANPFAFTEQGVAMLSAVLRSDTAIKVSIQIINAFVEMRKFIINYDSIFQRLSKVEFKQMEADNKINQILKIIEKNNVKPKQGIFFDGQIFDAYKFISGLIKDAKNSIILIDNYVDESVLTLFSKNQNINVYIYTKNIHKQLNTNAIICIVFIAQTQICLLRPRK